MNITKEVILKTNITRKPSKTYFIQGNYLVERDRKTRERKKVAELKTEKGFFYFPEGYNLQLITISRVEIQLGKTKIAA